MFQHTAARRRLLTYANTLHNHLLFQHTAARRRLPDFLLVQLTQEKGFNTQPPEGGCGRPTFAVCSSNGFNTQPPEGGCTSSKKKSELLMSFNTQPPEGGCRTKQGVSKVTGGVSTHSRPKAAAETWRHHHDNNHGFNTQPPEGGCSD